MVLVFLMLLLFVLVIIMAITPSRLFTKDYSERTLTDEGELFLTCWNLRLFHLCGAFMFCFLLGLPHLMLREWPESIVMFSLTLVFPGTVIYSAWVQIKAYVFISKRKLEFQLFRTQTPKLSFDVSEIKSIEFHPKQERPRKITINTKNGESKFIKVRFLKLFKGYKQLIRLIRELSENIRV